MKLFTMIGLLTLSNTAFAGHIPQVTVGMSVLFTPNATASPWGLGNDLRVQIGPGGSESPIVGAFYQVDWLGPTQGQHGLGLLAGWGKAANERVGPRQSLHCDQFDAFHPLYAATLEAGIALGANRGTGALFGLAGDAGWAAGGTGRGRVRLGGGESASLTAGLGGALPLVQTKSLHCKV